MSVMLEVHACVQNIIDKAREFHPEIPEVTVVIGAPGYTKKAQVHGHFAPRAWREREGEGSYGELSLSGESLQRGGLATLGTIIHELVHAYCNANEIQDTSNGHRYHNAKFRDMAESFGLVIDKAPTIGWSVTTVPEATAERYAEEVEDLDRALTQYRLPQYEFSDTKKAVKRFMYCPKCEDRLPVTKGWFERNESLLKCDQHDMFFEMEEVDPE